MKRIGLVVSLFALLTVPVGVSAELQPSDFKNASKHCKAVREQLKVPLFKQTYGTNHNRSNAFGKCVSRQARAEDQNQSNAAKECKAERGNTPESQAAFNSKYGTGENGHNAFGKCVSQKAREASQEQENAVVNAARTCRTERGQTAESRQAFAEKYGTNHNNRNAFGKCVSKHAREELQNNA